MIDAEWAAFALELDATFRGDFGPSGPEDTAGAAQEAAMRRHVGELPHDVATAALALLVEGGQVFQPTPAEVRGAVARITSTSSRPFAEVLRVLAQAGARFRGTPDAERSIVAEVAHRCGEGPARWVAARGSRAILHEPVNGDGLEGRPQGGAVRHRLEAELGRYVEQAQEDRRVGLALERAGRPELPSGRGPRRLDAARTLGLPEQT